MRKLLLLLVLFLFFSCQQSPNPPNEFSIQSNVRNIIQGTKGSILIIPIGSLVYEDGSEIKEEIKLKMTEAYSLTDILDNKLDTRTAEGLLVTGGMIHLQALTISGKKIKVADNKEITLQVAQNLSDTNNYQFFNQTNQLWANPTMPSPYLTYFPIEMQDTLYVYSDHSIVDWNNLIFTKVTDDLVNKNIVASIWFRNFLGGAGRYIGEGSERTKPVILDDKILEMSFISSKEYADRFSEIPPFDELYIGVHLTYLKNLDKPLWVVDSMIIDELKADLVYYKDDADKTSYNIMIRAIKCLTKFKNQYKTTFPPNTFTTEELAELDKFYKKQKINTLIQSYQIRKLGWHNIDYYYNKMPLIPTELLVKSEKKIQKILLVFKDLKVVLQGEEKDNKVYGFNSKNETTVRLPHVPAYLVALTEENGNLLFAKKEIKIGSNKTEVLDLKPITATALQQELDGIEQGYAK